MEYRDPNNCRIDRNHPKYPKYAVLICQIDLDPVFILPAKRWPDSRIWALLSHSNDMYCMGKNAGEMAVKSKISVLVS